MTGSVRLRVVTAAEAELLGLRQEALRRFDAYFTRRDPETLRAMRGSLNRIARTFSGDDTMDRTEFAWENVVDEEVAQMIWDAVAGHHSRATALKDATALRKMIECCGRVGLLDARRCRLAQSFDTHGRPDRKRAGRYLSPQDIAAMIESCLAAVDDDPPAARLRDLALVLVLASSGARRSEIAGVRLEDVDLEQRSLWLAETKFGEARSAFLHPIAVDALILWLEVRGHQGTGLFLRMNRLGQPLHGWTLTDNGIWRIVRAHGDGAGLGVVTPHDLRRFMVSNLLGEVDASLVARLAGHKSITTTMSYDRRPAEHARAAVDQLPLPRRSDLLRP